MRIKEILAVFNPFQWGRLGVFGRWAQRRSENATDRNASVEVTTWQYAEKAGERLCMDWYAPIVPIEDTHPDVAVLFLHGGGFSEGRRDDPRYVQFAQQLARNGIGVASVSYRLTMRGQSFGCDQQVEKKIEAFRNAAEDVWDATRFLLDALPATKRIVLCGSSAGAEAVLHAAYWPNASLPPGFRYAGVIGMAAAIMDLTWITTESALPTLLFHGVDDPLVPFGSASHHYCAEDQPGYLLLHGSGSIAQHLGSLGKPYSLIQGKTGGHGWADKPMYEHVDAIVRFLYTV